MHRDTVEHSGTLEVAEVASTGSDDTVVIREDPSDSISCSDSSSSTLKCLSTFDLALPFFYSCQIEETQTFF